MKRKEPQKSSKWSFSLDLFLSMVTLVIFLVGFLSLCHYEDTKHSFESQSDTLRIQSEQNIRESLVLTEDAWIILDESINDRIEQEFIPFMQEYERANGDPSRMDLVSLKKNSGAGYDFYIINESGVIIEATSSPELGIDFKKVPYFYEYLTTIRQKSGFYPDHIVRAQLGTGELRKFAYMPTPDHQYILEIGYTGELLETIKTRFDDQKKIERIVDVNPYIVHYRLFNTMGRREDTNELPEEPVQGYLQNVIATQSDLEVADTNHDLTTRYLFVDLKNPESGSDPSRIVELTYDTGRIHDALNAIIILTIIFAIISVSIGCIIAILFSRSLMRPISGIVRDVEVIAKGDLTHRIAPTHAREFEVLETSINSMVDSMRKAIEAIKDSEVFQSEVINNLPVAVFIKRVQDGRYIFWNKSCEQFFDRTAEEVIGKTDCEIFPDDVAALIKEEDHDAILNQGTIKNKIIQNRFKSEMIIHLIVVPIADSNGNLQYLMKIANDVTQENLHLKMDLLNSITRHDVLDQLSVILNHLERAQLKNTHEAIQTFFNTTLGSVESIKNQLAFVRMLQDLGIMSPAWQSVDAVVKDAILLVPASSVAITTDLDDIEIFADSLLPRVFSTLIADSLKHGGPGLSQIHVSVMIGDLVPTLTILYEDNGVGIAVSEKEKIFELGYGTGTGLGLLLIREILGYTDITIKETGEPGTGVRFEILVPKGRFRLFNEE